MLERLYIFVIRNDIWIYILAVLAILWYLSEWFRAQRLLRGASYGLEIERGRGLRNSALLFLLLFGALITFVAYVNISIAPTIPPDRLRPPTPTPNPFRTPFSSPTPRGTVPPTRLPPTPPLVATVTQRSGEAPPPTAVPATTTVDPLATLPPNIGGVGCSPERAIFQPANGALVRGEIVIFGTAVDPNFEAYTLEISGPQTSNRWTSLLSTTADQEVTDDALGRASLGAWANGRYLVRLIIFDQNGGESPPCTIEIILNNP